MPDVARWEYGDPMRSTWRPWPAGPTLLSLERVRLIVAAIDAEPASAVLDRWAAFDAREPGARRVRTCWLGSRRDGGISPSRPPLTRVLPVFHPAEMNPLPPSVTSMTFDQVIVIQQLPGHEEPTGQWLFERTIKPKADARGLDARLHLLQPDDDATALLWDIARECAREKRRLVLHIEMHGGPRGLTPKNGALVTWQTLSRPLRAINAATEMNLLVTLGVCYGGYMVNAVDHAEHAPFWGIVGPIEQMLNLSDIFGGYTRFFSQLLDDGNLGAALSALREGPYPNYWPFYTAEMVLWWGFDESQRRSLGPGQVRRVLREAMKEDRRRHRRGEIGAVRARADIERAYISGEAAFEAAKRRFLLIDRFPHLAARFPGTTDDAAQWVRADEAARVLRRAEDPLFDDIADLDRAR